MNLLKPFSRTSWISNFGQSIGGSLAVLIALVVLLRIGGNHTQNYLLQIEKERAQRQLINLGGALTNKLYDYFSIVQEFNSAIITKPEGTSDLDKLEDFGSQHIDLLPGIRDFYLAQEGTIEAVYPAEMGKDLIAKQLPVPSSPDHQNRLGYGLSNFYLGVLPSIDAVGQNSFFSVNCLTNPAKKQYIGIEVDIKSVLGGIDPVLPDSNLILNIREKRGENYQVLYGDPSFFETDPVVYLLQVPGTEWEFRAVPEGGWASRFQNILSLYWIAGTAAALFISVLVYLLLIRRNRLVHLVAKHTRDLEDEIWQRKRVEQALLANEARFRLIYENLPIGYQSLNIRGELIDVNQAWLEMMGYPRVEVLGSPFTDYLTPDSRNKFDAFFIQYKESGQASNFEFEMVREDGSHLFVILDGRIGYDEEGNFRQTHCILRDVTDSKKAEQALRESEERYSNLFQHNQSVMLLTDPQTGLIVEANPAACSFYGYSLKEFKNKNINDIDILPQEQVRRQAEQAEPLKERHFEFRHRLENGEIRDVEIYSGPITLQGRHLLYSIVHDISKRKKAEEALKASREELQRERDLISRIMETSPVSIFMVNPYEEIIFANAHACQTLNLSKNDPNDRVYQTPAFSLDSVSGVREGSHQVQFYKMISDSGPIYGRLYTLGWSSRDQVFLSISGTPLYDEAGQIDAAIVIAEDVSEEVLAERALRDSEERFRSAFEYATVGMALTDINGCFVMVNHALCEMLGYGEEELIGRGYIDLTHEQDIAANVELFQKSLAGECRSFAIEKRYFHKNGRTVWVALDSFLLRSQEGDPLYFITHMQDVTPRKEAEEALRESEKRYRLLFERNPQAMWVHDQETLQFLAINEAMERQYGFSRDELLTMTIKEIRPPDELPHLMNIANNTVPEYSHTGVWRHRRKDGTLLDVETSSYSIDFGGKPGRLVLTVDVTERLKAEKAAQQHAKELELLSQVSSILRKAQTREAMVSVIVDKAMEIVQGDVGALFMFEREGVKLAAQTGFIEPLDIPTHTFSDRLFRVSRDESILHIPDIHNSTDFQKSEVFQILTAGLRGCVLLPLKSTEAVIGLVFVGWQQPYVIRPDERRLLVAIAEIAGNALHRSAMMEMLEQRVSDRTRELTALYALSAIASETLDFNKVIEQSLNKLLQAIPNKVGAIHLYQESDGALMMVTQHGLPEAAVHDLQRVPVGKGLIGKVLVDGEPLLIADIEESEPLPGWDGKFHPQSYLGIPMRSHGKNTGVLSVFNQDGDIFNLEDIALLASGADQIGITVENLRLRQQAEQVAILRERERLARELHDSVTQSLYSLTLFSEVGQRMIRVNDTSQLDHILSRLSETSLQALKEMRLLVYELRPSALEKDGLIGAIHKRLEAVEKRAGIQTHFLADDTLVLPFAVEEALYGIALEALNNSLKHARASSVTVSINTEERLVVLKVVDNGLGFDPATIVSQGGLGLVSLRERTERLGGNLDIQSIPGKGTSVRVSIGIK